MARHDARTGRLSAEEAVEFAAEIARQVGNVEVLELELNDARHDIDHLQDKIDGDKDESRELRFSVAGLVEDMTDPTVADHKAMLAKAARELRRLFGLGGGR